MGNCLVIQNNKEIKVMSVVDGEILKALPPAPLPPSKVVDSIVSSDTDYALPKRQHLNDPAGDMGQLYRLFPGPAKAPAAAVADPAGAVVRVKLVISKQELRKMLGKDGQQGVSLDDMVALMRRDTSEETSCCRSAGWRPALHSIPEGSDFFY